MRGPYSDYAAPPVYLIRTPERRGIRFSRTELVQLGIAIVALSGALTLLNLLQYGFYSGGLAGIPLGIVAMIFGVALVAVGTGVGLHEVAHKVVAQRYGHWAEFRYYPMGLLLAFVFAFMGFIYGAPGATVISGSVTQGQSGRISAAGPLTNVVLGLGFLALRLPLTGDIAFIPANIAFMNFVLAGFNMLPVLPLDGAKVWAWNRLVYVGIVALVVGLFGTAYVFGLLL